MRILLSTLCLFISQMLTAQTVQLPASNGRANYIVDMPDELEAISTDPKKPDLMAVYRIGNKIYVGFYQRQCKGIKKDGSRCRQTMLIEGTGRCRYHQNQEGKYQCSLAGCNKPVSKRGDLCKEHENR